MALLSLLDISVAFGGPPVLDQATLAIDRGDRVCLLGRNGAGKSTLLQLLDGTLTPDSGEIVRQGTVVVSRLQQDVPDSLEGTIFEVTSSGLGEPGKLLARYHQTALALAAHSSDRHLKELDRLHQAIDAADAWQLNTRVTTVLEQLGLDPDASFNHASGGRKRHALLARALVRQPDILLLDEPTNHLDIGAIEQLERLLVERGITLVFVTHDRAFLRAVATRIVELDRGALADWGGDYDIYLERKEQALHAESRERAEFDRRLAEEEVWIRTGIQARRTRNEGRVRALEKMRVERSARRERVGTARLQLQEAERSGRLVAEAKGVSFAHGDLTIARDVSLTVMRGDRVGLVGPNGAGKTTLLRLLLGELAPDEGSVRVGTNLELAYFDQLREQLDPNATVFESIADGAEFVTVGGQQRHVHSWLGDFLFPPDRARTPVRALSGGERNRLLLARLFTRSFNLLVLDEPTNDLDIETLDLLEDRLLEFGGTLLLVSHDRAFLDAVVTSTLVFEGRGVVREYVGGYTDWLRQRPAPPAGYSDGGAGAAAGKVGTKAGSKASKGAKGASAKAPRPRKLSMKESRELADLPERIEAAEAEQQALYERLADPATQRDASAVLAANARLAEIEGTIGTLMERWEALETIASAT
jgi:ATP-binding cassette subfamily F protein uup